VRVRFEVGGVSNEALALVDTGFDGFLAVPEAVAASWSQPLHADRVQTASGQVIAVPVFAGRLELTDQPGPFTALLIAIGDEFLLGIAAIRRFKMTFDHGQRILVEP
jgi:predicted aspartyl protease